LGKKLATEQISSNASTAMEVDQKIAPSTENKIELARNWTLLSANELLAS